MRFLADFSFSVQVLKSIVVDIFGCVSAWLVLFWLTISPVESGAPCRLKQALLDAETGAPFRGAFVSALPLSRCC